MLLLLPSSHPAWGLSRLAVLLITLTGILYLSANSFDKTELYTIIVVMAGAAVAEGASSALSKSPDYPAIGLARLVLVMLTLTATLYMTATNFDKTELRVIVGLFLTAAGAEGVTGMFWKKRVKSSTETE